MNRKLNRSLIALCASALALAAVMLVATPSIGVDRTGEPAPELAGTESGTDSEAGEASAPTAHRGISARSSRRGLAMPYFSFARGVRRIGG